VLALARRLSRDRELVADRAAARLTGDTAALASALTTLADSPEPPEEDARTARTDRRTAVRGLCLLAHGFDPGADDWLAPRAHPPVERRAERLRAVAADQEG
jgi:heat shock protein HtpX